MKIAWIGTGVMGAPMALNLSRGGYDVVVQNRTFSKAQALEPEVKAFETIEDAVKDADVVFSIVGYPNDVENVANTVFRTCKPGTIYVDMTTSSPSLAKSLYEKGHSLGIHCVDAPVTGGDVGAINATLSIMVGGSVESYETIKPLLEKMGTTITYMGPGGSGQHAKLANQTAIAGAIAGCAEALTYAIHHGLDPHAMLAVITGGSASSWQAANNGPKMITDDMNPGFFTKHFLKDLKLASEEKGLLSLPVLQQVTQIYQSLVDLGYENDGTQCIIHHYNSK
ncbi:oxidoreductase [Erysipelothrix larvae]|uniref:Oxidoreductase n=1 Tax=Erysipelothrix larvae TaxID=1514105 RepID=A0A109UH13_9FIRM|nr:NAD(P)-dependent oxidoreductase [Erysipelothrix larvae]AMC93540.1 oxidoreductase [Erysipelothrix larvae]